MTISKLGIIAGNGALPKVLAERCKEMGITPYIIALDGHADISALRDYTMKVFRLGLTGQMIDFMREEGVKDLVFIGGVKRPSLWSIRPDLKTTKFLIKLGFRSLGDDSLLKAIRTTVEEEGFNLHSIQDFVEEIVCPMGAIGRHTPSQQDMADIEIGFQAAQTLGQLDIGQAVIVEHGLVLAVEGAEGTQELIKRTAALRKSANARSAILVKSCKPQQDRKLDLPTIGPDTVEACIASGLSGIVVQAEQSLIYNLQDVISKADENGLFVYGYRNPHEEPH